MAARVSGNVKIRPRPASDDVEPLQQAVEYFTTVKERTPSNGNLHLDTIEGIAFERGLPPDVIESLLDVVMSARLVDRFNTRLIKCLIPASVVPECAVTNAISWMCTRKPSINVQVLFIRWLLTVFDLLDSKKQLHSLYGIIFFYLQNDKLCPYICHLLYLLTKKENVKRFRVKKLIDLQAKMGMQSNLMALILLYKIHAPEFVCLTCPRRLKNLQVSRSFWKKAIEKVQNNGYRQLSGTPELVNITEPPMRKRKKKMHRELIPVVSSAPHLTELSGSLMQSKSFPLEQLATFSQLLDNFDRIEFPAQMGSLLRSPLLLHYINWVKDDTAFLRLDFWLAQTLQEEFADCNGDSLQKEKEFIEFLNIIIRTQEFLQEGFSCCEDFAFKSLSLYDSSWCSSQILALLTRISPSTDVISFYFDPLMKLFFTSSIYFKCSVIESLTSLLMKWLTWHSVCVADLDRQSPNVLQSPQNVSLSGLVNSVSELVEFTARISVVALHMEAYSSLLLHFILNFYETVSDMYLKYSLPLVILPPAGIIYPALLSLESVSLNQLCHIMYRYRTNLTALKSLDLSTNVQIGLKVNRKTFQQYNAFMKTAVSCLWTSRNFEQDIHPMGIGIEYNLLEQTKVPDSLSSFTLVNHPALMGHAINFTQKGWPNGKKRLHAIQGKIWNWYVKYLYNQGLDGLKHFLESCIHAVSTSEH
ncbi:centromere protein I isoform X1 [Hemiscyllium ocellatum]|uniref:centromere protein I isoform X1 n=1 Tax=Hemiscyllium ocellatum TaxID=170820 RepID=UPI0029667CD1|nr:centromere protein I isoform X1 [Hemiscyllium ocellatum]